MTADPTTLEEAVLQLMEMVQVEELRWFAAIPFESASARVHSTWGRTLRNQWGLWRNSPLAQWFQKELKLDHADDMSAVILAALWTDLNGCPRRTHLVVKDCRAHWDRLDSQGSL